MVYVPNRDCGGVQSVVVSKDNGVTWAIHPVQSATSSAVPGTIGSGDDPAVGIDDNGRVYFSFSNAGTAAAVATSDDFGVTWNNIFDVGAIYGINNAAFPAAVAGSAGRAVVAYYGSTSGTGDSNTDKFTGFWHLYVAVTYDGGGSWTSYDATPSFNVQGGCISLAGTLGGSCADRNLLDFMDMTIDSTGRIQVGYAAGCATSCTTSTSTNSFAAIARQSSGACLFAASACGAVTISSVPPGGLPLPHADTCDPNTVIFSSNSAGTPALNSHALVCIPEGAAGGAGVADTEFINPGSDQVSIRYTVDLGTGVPTLYAIVNGLGASNVNVTLTRTTSTTGGTTYNSGQVHIDPTATGNITATVKRPDGTVLDVVTFHTVN